jgi:N-methylhydantoinase A
MRFRFQIHALTIPVPEDRLDAAAIDTLVQRFIDTYEARFGKGSAFTAAGIELTTYRVVARCDVERPQLRGAGEYAAADGTAPPGERQVYVQGHWRCARIVLPRHLRVGERIDGVAIIEMPDTTIVIGPGQHAAMDEHGNVVLELTA